MTGGDSRTCRYPSGCRDPIAPYLEALTPFEMMAFRIFIACQTQWNIVGTFSGAIRTGLRYDGVRAVAESFGCEWSQDLLEAIALCESMLLSQEATRRAAATPPTQG